jgi:cell division protein FtsB
MTSGMKKAIFLFAILTILLLFSSVFGEKGFLHQLKLKKEMAAFKESNAEIQRESTLLRNRIQKLNEDDRVLEKLVRDELGWVRDGEILYRFKSLQAQEKSGPGEVDERSR